jgi:hypothetical protein
MEAAMKMTKAVTRQQEARQEVFSRSGEKKPWQEPKLAFIKPKLIKHGKLEEVTGQFFGAFTPHPPGT